ncbi:hypothetical protein [Streptomyces sp. NPDC058486]|uniref:hypothetical protein n=1 Tax=unclassified Streptomyces TaxID=2593676 RepID=UPI0036676243
MSVRVRPSGRPAQDSTEPAPATPTISVPGNVDAGTWVPLKLTGFEPGHVDIRIDGKTVYTVRADETGRFARHGVVPASTYDGTRTISAVQGDRSAHATVSVASGLRPLPDLIDQSTLRVRDVDSEEIVGENGAAVNAIDGDTDMTTPAGQPTATMRVPPLTRRVRPSDRSGPSVRPWPEPSCGP